jgi:hypothetical protein
MIILCQGEKIPVHRLVLACNYKLMDYYFFNNLISNVVFTLLLAGSPVFRKMFTTEMKEEKEGQIEIQDFDKETVERMLEWMYTTGVELINVDSNGCLDLFRYNN